LRRDCNSLSGSLISVEREWHGGDSEAHSLLTVIKQINKSLNTKACFKAYSFCPVTAVWLEAGVLALESFKTVLSLTRIPVSVAEASAGDLAGDLDGDLMLEVLAGDLTERFDSGDSPTASTSGSLSSSE